MGAFHAEEARPARHGWEVGETALYDNFAYVIAYSLFGIAFVVANVAGLSRLLRPKVKDRVKETIYECGEPTIGSSWVRFDIRFYTVAIVFLLFEVEVAFLFPWAVIYNRLSGHGIERTAETAGAFPFGLPFVFVEAAIFLLILGVGLIYVWAKGDLDWVKATTHGIRPEGATPGVATSLPAESAEPLASDKEGA